MNDFKRNKHFPEKIASNLKFLNNLQPEWSRHVTIVHQIKNLHTVDYTQLYDFLKYNQKKVDDLRAKRLAKTQDPLALMAISNNPFNYSVFHSDQPSSNNQMQMVRGNGGNQFRQYAGQNNGKGNVVAARAEGNENGDNGNQIRCYNYRGLGHLARNCTVRPRRRDAVYLQTQLLIAQKEATGIQLQTEEFDLMVAAADLDEIEKNFKIQFLKESAKCVRDFKFLAKEADESLAKHNALELEIEHLLREVVSQDIMSIVQNISVVDSSNLQTELEPYNDMQQKIERLQAQLGDQKGKSKDTRYVSNTLDPLSQNLENENVELEFQVLNYAKENAHLKTTYKNLFDSISVTGTQTKTIIDSLKNKLHDTIYENAKLRAQLFDKVSEQKGATHGTSTNTKFVKQSILGKPPSSSRPKLYDVTPLPKSKAIPKINESHAFSKLVTSNLVPTPTESKVVKNDNVISPGIFRINPFKASRVDNFVPNKHVKASVRTKPITVSQPHVITKNDLNSKTNGLSPKNVKSTTRTRRPQSRNNPKSNKVPFKSKSSCLSNKLEKIEENHRSLQSSNYPDHTSSECNNIKLGIRNKKSEVICATCKQCLITANHDECVLQYVNGMKSRKKNQSANVSKSANQKKHKPRVWKPKRVESKERLVSPKPSTPRSCLRWSPTGRTFDLKGKIIATSESECQSDCFKGDNACTSNPQEPICKRFPNLTFSMTCGQNWFYTLLIPLLSEYKPKDKQDHEDNEYDT
ncbi:hypothetical protein Tco_1097099 [Tanacetum coccineum]